MPERNKQRFFAWCGIIGPVLFMIVLIILGYLQPQYNHVSQFMSELGAVGAPNALIMNAAGFFLLGVFLVVFAFGLNRDINQGEGSQIAPFIIAVSGFAFMMVGVFPCDPNCVNVSVIGKIHGGMAFIAQFALIFAPAFLIQRLQKDDRWQNYHIYSLLLMSIALVLGIVYQSYIFQNITGLLQRLSFGVPLLWVELMSLKLLRVS